MRPKNVISHRPISRGALAALCMTLALASAAAAQLDAAPRDRDDPLRHYKNTRDGADLKEWVRRLEDPRPEIRLAAVKSMGESGDPEAARHLMEAMLDADLRVAARAVDYLGRLKAVEATEFLAERLFLKDASQPLRRQILIALGRIGDSRASGPILEFIERTDDPDLRGTAIYAIGEIGDSTALADLGRIAERETDPKLKQLAKEAGDKIGGRRFEPTPVPTGAVNPLLRPFEP